MSADDKQVILTEVLAARAEKRPVNQQLIRVVLPHLSQSAVNSRVARVRNSFNNPRPPRPRRSARASTAAPPQGLPTATLMTAVTTPVTDAVQEQSITSLASATTDTAERADDEVQVALELARFSGLGPFSSGGMEQSEQDNQGQELLTSTLFNVRNQVQTAQTAFTSREETTRMQEEDILSSWVERVQLQSTFRAMERELQTVRSQLQATQVDIASKNQTIKMLNQDLRALQFDQEIELRQLKSTLTAKERELLFVRTHVDAAKADIASRDETIKKLDQDIQALRHPTAPTNEILLQRKLDLALQANVLKEEAMAKLKSDMKAVKEGFSARMHYAQMNIKDKVTQNFIDEVQNLKKQLYDLDVKYNQDVSSYTARIADLEQELRYTTWVTDLHKYLTSVEEDLQAIADRLSPFLASQDRSKLYSKRDPSEISAHPTMRWVSRVYGRYYRMAPLVTADMESDMTKWWSDRNYFAHRSSTDELNRRGKVVANAHEMHRLLAKLIEEFDKERDADLAQLANDAFSDLSFISRM
jgi:hypothetical protein